MSPGGETKNGELNESNSSQKLNLPADDAMAPRVEPRGDPATGIKKLKARNEI
jgi:hypothetical protein